jgi:hypothetical protein
MSTDATEVGERRGEDRGWEAGEFDKGSGMDNGRVLLGYTVLAIVIAVLAPGLVCSSIVSAGLIAGIWVLLLLMFLMGRMSGRQVAVQRRKFFDMGPDRLSRVVEGVLDDATLRYRRTGPAEREPDIWSDAFLLVDHPWEGIEVLVQRDGLIARESPCRVTVQCGERKDPLLDRLQDLVDSAAQVERERGRESREWRVYSKYVTPPY